MSAVFGETLTFDQGAGPSIQLVAFGDEHYHRLETASGFTAVYDATLERYCYAKLANERFASTGVPVDRTPPANLRRHLREPLEVRKGTFEARRSKRLPPSDPHSYALRAYGANRGLLAGRQLSTGAVKGLTILVNFQDAKSTATSADVDRMLNRIGYSDNGNFCSVRDYYRLMSAGKLDFTNDVVGPFQLRQNRAYYFESSPLREALDLAVASGVDLTRFDSRNEGIVDVLCVMYAGQTQYQGELWPHNGFAGMEYGAMRTGLYLMTSFGRTPVDLTIGTFCHESGHLLCRFPDLYDYGDRDNDSGSSAGLGVYCLMSAGNHLDGGRTPAPICGYLRDLAGWCETIDLRTSPGRHEAVHGDYGKILKYGCADAPNEYFLIENRSKIGLDQHLPASGLAVLHCDILGSNEWQAATASHHYQCALLQTDGRQDLERDVNQGDGGDLFAGIAGTALSDTTQPAARQWNGSESGLVVSAVGTPGQRMSFRAGEATGPDGDAVLKGEAVGPNPIPDDDPAGIASTIPLRHEGVVRRLVVSVEIEHSYVGDLRVELLSPKGSRAILHRRLGGGKDDLVAAYDSKRVGSVLRSLVGEPIAGNWIVRVSDLAARDKGTLRRWSIEVEPAV